MSKSKDRLLVADYIKRLMLQHWAIGNVLFSDSATELNSITSACVLLKVFINTNDITDLDKCCTELHHKIDF